MERRRRSESAQRFTNFFNWCSESTESRENLRTQPVALLERASSAHARRGRFFSVMTAAVPNQEKCGEHDYTDYRPVKECNLTGSERPEARQVCSQ